MTEVTFSIIDRMNEAAYGQSYRGLQAEKKFAEAELRKARAEVRKADVEKRKADVEKRKADVQARKADAEVLKADATITKTILNLHKNLKLSADAVAETMQLDVKFVQDVINNSPFKKLSDFHT